MKTIEVAFVVVILLSALVIASQFTALPSPRLASSPGLRELALTTLQNLDSRGDLSRTVFSDSSSSSWGDLQIALSSSLPPNIVYNLTVYDIVKSSDGTVTYSPAHSISNSAGSLGVGSEATSYLVTSTNVTFTEAPHKIEPRPGKNATLYILNCNDSNGWWITGYTGQSLASNLLKTLSPYFQTTILVNSTYELGLLLNRTLLTSEIGESIEDAVVINTFGEAVPIPAGYYTTEGYDSANDTYAKYAHILGQKVKEYNWTWVSIVGYPFYYVTNTVTFADRQNDWGIYGMVRVRGAGLNAFLQGINDEGYTYDPEWITGDPDDDPRLSSVYLSTSASYYSNYYGLYPAPYQTATRAFPSWILNEYPRLDIPAIGGYVFEPVGDWIPGATYTYVGSDSEVHGVFVAIGLTRIPDVRVAELALLMYYRPRLHRSEFTASGTTRLIVLQLSQQGA